MNSTPTTPRGDPLGHVPRPGEHDDGARGGWARRSSRKRRNQPLTTWYTPMHRTPPPTTTTATIPRGCCIAVAVRLCVCSSPPPPAFSATRAATPASARYPTPLPTLFSRSAAPCTVTAVASCHSPSRANPATTTHSSTEPSGEEPSCSRAPVWSADPDDLPHARPTVIHPRTRCRTPLAAEPTRAPIVRPGGCSARAAAPRREESMGPTLAPMCGGREPCTGSRAARRTARAGPPVCVTATAGPSLVSLLERDGHAAGEHRVVQLDGGRDGVR